MTEGDDSLSQLHDPLIRALRRRGVPEDEAQDLAQESSLRALSRIERPREAGLLLGWLVKVALRCRIDRLRRASIDSKRLHARELPGPVETAVAREKTRRIENAIDDLGAGQAQVLRAFYHEGRSLKEIAARLDLPMGTVKARLHRARETLARVLAEEETP